jgi:hypothetical protein
MEYVALDQYGQAYKLWTNFPRKELLKKLGYSSAKKMYSDKKELSCHVGYVIGGLWLSLYKCEAIHEL